MQHVRGFSGISHVRGVGATDYLQDRVSKKKRFYPDEDEDAIIEDSRDRFRVDVCYYILDVFVSQFEHRFADFRRMALEKFAVMNPKHFCHPDAARKVIALAEFYSEDLSKADDVVDEFATFRTMYRELSMEKHELNTHSILPFLIHILTQYVCRDIDLGEFTSFEYLALELKA